MNSFVLYPANRFVWNRNEFIEFLIKNIGQEISISTNNEGPCLETCGVYQLLEQFGYTKVEIITTNCLEQHSIFYINIVSSFFFFETAINDYSPYHYWNQKKIFGCFYNRPLWHRIGLAATLQSNYNDESLINVRCNPHDQDQLSLFEIQELLCSSENSFVNFAQVFRTWPCQVEAVDTYTVRPEYDSTTEHTKQLVNFYPDFLIDVVAETWISGRTFFLTEKTVRPMLMKKPMIVMGATNTLMYLRRMGFKTFYEFWDEDYDGYGEKDRYNKILELIDNLSKKSSDELSTIYKRMQPILDHNYNLLMTQGYKREFDHD